MLQTYDFFEALFGTATNELGMSTEIYAFVSFILAAGFFGSLFACMLNLIAFLLDSKHHTNYLSVCIKTALVTMIFYIAAVIVHVPLNPTFPSLAVFS